jgi:hypothetical protein
MAYQVPASFVCWYIVQIDNKKLKDCPPPGVEAGHYGQTNCSRGIVPDRWTSEGHLEIPLSFQTYTTTLLIMVAMTATRLTDTDILNDILKVCYDRLFPPRKMKYISSHFLIFLNKFSGNRASQSFWIGLNAIEAQNTWVWVSNYHFLNSSNYQNWVLTQTTNQCVMDANTSGSTFVWQPQSCNTKSSFVCELGGPCKKLLGYGY